MHLNENSLVAISFAWSSCFHAKTKSNIDVRLKYQRKIVLIIDFCAMKEIVSSSLETKDGNAKLVLLFAFVKKLEKILGKAYTEA